MPRIRKQKKKTPSRIRYEKSHPTVSFRPDQELYDTLQAVRQAEGKSYADVLKVGVGLLKVKIGEEMEIYSRGFLNGHRKAKERYLVTYKCCVCGKPMEIREQNVKEAIRRYLHEEGWGHANCINHRY